MTRSLTVTQGRTGEGSVHKHIRAPQESSYRPRTIQNILFNV